MSGRWPSQGEQGVQLKLMMLVGRGAHHEHQVLRPGMAEKFQKVPRDDSDKTCVRHTRGPSKGCS